MSFLILIQTVLKSFIKIMAIGKTMYLYLINDYLQHEFN